MQVIGYRVSHVIELTVVPDELHMVQKLLDIMIFAIFPIFLHGAQIHGMFDNTEVIRQIHPQNNGNQVPFQSTGCLKSYDQLCSSNALRMMLTFRVYYLSRDVDELRASDDSMFARGGAYLLIWATVLAFCLIQRLFGQPIINYNNSQIKTTMKQNPQYQYQLVSQHILMTVLEQNKQSFVHFNQSRDKFITCGEQGEINVYSLADNVGITKIASANLFDEVPVCVKWGSPISGGFIAVGGSRGSLLILSIDYLQSMIVVQKHFNFGHDNVPYSLDWHPDKPLLLMGTLNGCCYTVSQAYQQWTFSAQPYQFQNCEHLRVLVSFGIPESNLQFAAVEDVLYYLVPNQNRTIKLLSIKGQTIYALIARTQCVKGYLQLYILSNKKLRTYEVITSSDQKQPKLKQLQEISVDTYRCDQMSWGWNQSELVLSATTITNQEKAKKSENYVKQPVVFKRKLNGKLVLA